jgi:hypothetical protein
MLAALLMAVLLPPMFNGKYKPILDGRYLMPLIPVVFVGIGCLIAHLGNRSSQRLQPFVALALVALTAGLLTSPLPRLEAFYEESTEDGHSNQLYLSSLARIRAERGAAEAVWLDPRLRDVKTQAGDTAGSTFSWLLPVSRIPIAAQSQDAYQAAAHGDIMIVHRSTAAELRQGLRVVYIDGFGANGKGSPSFRVIRATPLAS